MIFLNIIFLFFFFNFIEPQVACAPAEIKEGQFISDDEIESTLTEWLQEIFNVAGISIKPKVLLLASSDVNAGATFGGYIIIYTGFLTRCKNVSQVLGVLAHEAGHIKGAHLATQSAAQKQAMVPAIMATILGGAAALLTGNGAPLAAGAMGGMSIFERGLYSHSRAQEESADSAALSYLDKLGWPSDGLIEFLNILNNLYTGTIDPYLSTHPLTPDRMQKIKLYVNKSKGSTIKQIPPAYEEKFRRIQAKVIGYMHNPQKVLREYKDKDNSVEARLARSIAYYRLGNTTQALSVLNNLIKQLPQDSYLQELNGQILFETGHIKDALNLLKKAAALRPHSTNLNLLLAHALIESSSSKGQPGLNEAIKCLKQVTAKDEENVFAWRLLARAYGKQEKFDFTAWALAEEAWCVKDIKMVKAQAKKAEKSADASITRRARDLLEQAKISEQG